MDRADTTVFIVNGDSDERDSLYRLMQSGGLDTTAFASAEQFLDGCTPQDAGCVLLELQLPGMGGLELMVAMRSRHYGIPIIVMTGSGNVSAAVQSMKLGAIDFMEKPVDGPTLVANVKAAIAIDAAWRRSVAATQNAQSRLASLTHREQELLLALMEGKSSKQIAAETGLSPRTVENHRAHMLAKTGAKNVAHAVRIGMLAGMTCEEPTRLRTSGCCRPFPIGPFPPLLACGPMRA
ncbi:MAG: response regulator transcription factor [Bacillota bacterium]